MTPTALLGDSDAIVRLRQLIDTVAPTRLPVLIEGETGTGKELVAAQLHQRSRRTGAFVAFNVCAVGESMFEDALFGHVRGAYTGAAGESLGFLREANGGTAFLDEISGLPLAQQAKLLRALETGVFRPIGSSRDARSDFRTIAATNEGLEALVAAGRFRADLAHRLSGIVLSVPPLRERLDDVPLLAVHFARRSNAVATLSPAAERLLQEREWPGNVRELRQVVDTAMIFARGGGRLLDVEALDIALRHRTAPRSAWTPSAASPASPERDCLVAVLADAKWDTGRAARSIGVHRATIYRRAKRLGIRVRDCRGTGVSAPAVPLL